VDLAVDPGTVIAGGSSGTTSSHSPEVRVPIREQRAGPLSLLCEETLLL
jgi:hypothetical protein